MLGVEWTGLEKRARSEAARLCTTVLCTALALAGACAQDNDVVEEPALELGAASATLVVNEEKSEGHPVAAQLGNVRYLVWGGTNADKNINVLSSLREGEWTHKQTLAERTNGSGGLGLTVFAGRLAMAWTGSDDKLNVMMSSDGVTWTQKRTFDAATSRVAPAVHVHDGRLYLAYTGTDERLNLMWSDDGSTFSGVLTLDERSSYSPSLTSFEGTLLLGWTGTDSHLNIAELDAQGKLGRKGTSYETSHDGTFLLGLGHQLIVAWRGNGNEWLNHAPLSRTFVGSWLTTGSTGVLPDKRTMDEKSNRMPTFADFAGSAALLWRGTDAKVNILEHVYEIPRADLTVSLAGNAPVLGGSEPLGLDVTLRNEGPNAAEAPLATLTLPEGATLVSASGGDGVVVSQGPGSLILRLPELAAGASASTHLELTLACTLKPSVLTFAARVSSATVDPNANNDVASTSVQVVPRGPTLVAPPARALASCSLEGAYAELGVPTVDDVCDPAPKLTVRIVSMAGVSVDVPVTDETLFPLCESVVEYRVVNAAGLSATATQTVSVGFEHDRCASGACCPEGSIVVDLDDLSSTYASRRSGECVLGTETPDTVSLSGASAGFFGGAGDDTLTATATFHDLRGGEGNDTLVATGGGVQLWGNTGDDVLFVSRGENELIPGPGLDSVIARDGDNVVHILDVCEIERGEQIEMGNGYDVLISPVPEAQLAALGLLWAGIDEIRVDGSRACASECRMMSERCAE
jgi:hypothetical protein